MNDFMQRITDEHANSECTAHILPSHTLLAVAAEDYQPEWLIEHFWPVGSYGMLAGAEKTLKSHIAMLMAMSVASGRPLLGRFDVRRRGPVVYYCGEGSRHLVHRKMAHLASLIDLPVDDLNNLPIVLVDEVAALSSDVFKATLRSHLGSVRPELVILDPLYTYHGGATEAGNVHAVGAMLSELAAPCIEAGAALAVVNHFNKIGAHTLSLASITQAGGREWADSWVLLKHREAAEPDLGQFKLLMAVGSRQWGGCDWDIDLAVGTVDSNFTYQGTPSVSCQRPEKKDAGAGAEMDIFQVLADHPGELGKTDIFEKVGGNRASARATFNAMAKRGAIRWESMATTDSKGRSVSKKFWWSNQDYGEDS